VDVTAPSEDEIDLMEDVFEFHQLTVEDAILPQNQPKIEDYDDYLHIVIHELNYPSHDNPDIKSQELNILHGKNYVFTIHSNPLPSIARVYQRCQNKKLQCMQRGGDFLLHAIIDNVVDNYFPVVDRMEEQIEVLEDEVLTKADQTVLEKIVELKRTVITVRNFIVPQRKILGILSRADSAFIKPEAAAYFRDVYDHVVRVADIMDTYRDILNSTMEAYMSMVSRRLNEIMKTLTIITTILMPLSVITSFYGMNVKLPEFEWGIWGYLTAVGLLAIAFFGMLIFLKRKKWL